MERYSRLIQFFTSPEKTLGDLYDKQISPYTSNTTINECKIPTDSPTLASSEEECNTSVFSQVTSENEISHGRKIVLNDPPTRLQLKRRPKTKLEERKSEDCKPDAKVTQWSSNAGSWIGVGNYPDQTESSIVGHSPSRKKESSHSSDRGSTDRSGSDFGNHENTRFGRTNQDRNVSSRRQKDKDTRDGKKLDKYRLRSKDERRGSSNDRHSSDQGSPERKATESRRRSSPEYSRKRRRSPEHHGRSTSHFSDSSSTRSQHITSAERSLVGHQNEKTTEDHYSFHLTHDEPSTRTPNSPHQFPEYIWQPKKEPPKVKSNITRSKGKYNSTNVAPDPNENAPSESCDFFFEPTLDVSLRVCDTSRSSEVIPRGDSETTQSHIDVNTEIRAHSPSRPTTRSRGENSSHSDQPNAAETNLGSVFTRERRYRTSNFTLPSVRTNSRFHFHSENSHQHADSEQESAGELSVPSLNNANVQETQDRPEVCFVELPTGKSTDTSSETCPVTSGIAKAQYPTSILTEAMLYVLSGCSVESSPFQSPSLSSQESQFAIPLSTSATRDFLKDSVDAEKGYSSALERQHKAKSKFSTIETVDESNQNISNYDHKHILTQVITSRVHPAHKLQSSLQKEESDSSLSDGQCPSSTIASYQDKENTVDINETTTTVSKSPLFCLKDFSSQRRTLPKYVTTEEEIRTTHVDKTTRSIGSNRGVQQPASKKSSSSSDVTDAESVINIEKFKQTIRSVEVPQELLEPQEQFVEKENLQILETISESPLEDYSEPHISSNYGDDEHGSAEEVMLNSHRSGSAARVISGDTVEGRRRENSGSDLSDIQLHYAYGRNQNDQLELQWIKLEKIVDSVSESSEGSTVESPFNRHGDTSELQIRSMNLPHVSTAQRHGDADRGPLATCLTLPTQSPGSGEDSDLAIVVMHEESLTEHQKNIITRFRSGMKRRRSRCSSEAVSSGSQLLSDQGDQPIVIPISDPRSGNGSATGFAVIANSEPDVPLSVDLDVKSWLSHKTLEVEEIPIVVSQCLSKLSQEFVSSSYSEGLIPRQNKEHVSSYYNLHESQSPDWNIRDPLNVESWRLETETDFQTQCTPAQPTKKMDPRKEYISIERPHTAPPINEIKEPRWDGQLDQTFTSKRRTRKRSPDGSLRSPTSESSYRENKLSSPKQSLPNTRSNNPSPGTQSENERPTTPLPGGKRETTTLDNTVQILFEPKTNALIALENQNRKSQKYNRVHLTEKKLKGTESDNSRFFSPQNRPSSGPSSYRDKSPVTDQQKSSDKLRTKSESSRFKSPERPRTASPSTDMRKFQGICDLPNETPKSKDRRADKRISSTPTTNKYNRYLEMGRVESNASVDSHRDSTNRSRSKTNSASKTPAKQPQRASGYKERRTSGNIEILPTCESFDSTGSSDSGSVPRYRLKRNIAYISEYRKTIDSLRAKCVMKDHMIDALIEELQSLSPPEDTYQRLLLKLSNRKINGPPPRRDYSFTEVTDILPRDKKDSRLEIKKAVSLDVASKCVCPTEFRVVGKVGCDSLLLTWKSSPQHDTVAGYEVEVDGQLSQRVRSPSRTSALLMDLDLSRAMRFALRTLRTGGLAPCHAPLEIDYAPTADVWALEDRPPAPTAS